MRATALAGAAFGLLAIGAIEVEASGPGSQPADAPPSMRANALALQAGFLPGVSFVGFQYARILHRHIDVAAAVSYGLTFDASLVPRLRIAATRLSISAGVGPSVAFDKGGVG